MYRLLDLIFLAVGVVTLGLLLSAMWEALALVLARLHRRANSIRYKRVQDWIAEKPSNKSRDRTE